VKGVNHRSQGGSGVSARERDVFACLADTVVAPAPPLPPVRRTDALAFLDRYLAASPARNRHGLRAALIALDAGPRAFGFGARLRVLPREQRVAYLDRLEATHARPLVYALRALAQLAYYGDREAALTIGYDADANVARGRGLRSAERRW